MNSFLSLPYVIVADVLCSWIGLKDFAKVDSVHLGVARQDFLHIFRQPGCCLKTWLPEDEYGASDDAIEWFIKRKFSMRNITLTEFSDVNVYENYLLQLGSSVVAARGRVAPEHALDPLRYCENLISLDLVLCEISPSLRTVFEYCVRLREFRCDFSDDNHSATGSDFDGLACPSIKVLKLEQFKDISLAIAFLQLAVSAEVVVLSKVERVADAVIDALSGSVTTLALQGINITPEAFCELYAVCPNLVHLQTEDLNHGGEFTQDMMASLEYLKDLKSVDLSFSNNMEEEILLELASSCGEQVTELLVANCDFDRTILATILPQFTSLTSFSVTYLHTAKLDFSLLHNLTSLRLVAVDGMRTTALMNRIVTHCTNLELLSLEFSPNLDYQFPSDDIYELIDGLPNLQTLHLVNFRGGVAEEEDMALWRAARPGTVVSNKESRGLEVLRNNVTHFLLC